MFNDDICVTLISFIYFMAKPLYVDLIRRLGILLFKKVVARDGNLLYSVGRKLKIYYLYFCHVFSTKPSRSFIVFINYLLILKSLSVTLFIFSLKIPTESGH